MRPLERNNPLRQRISCSALVVAAALAASPARAQNAPASDSSPPSTTAPATPAAPAPAADPPASTGHFSAAQLINDAENSNRLPPEVQVDTPAAGTREQQVRQASAGYVQEIINDADTRQVPESYPYYRGMGRAMATDWSPPRAHPPGPVGSVRNTLFTTREHMIEIGQQSTGDGVAYAIGEEMDRAHPHSPMPRPHHTATAISRVTSTLTEVQVEVDQNERGEVLAVRVVHSSHDSDLDRSAMEAARAAALAQPATEMPGGWRSRWLFQQSVGRDPLFLLNPGMPGDIPAPMFYVEAEFDEVTGQTEAHYPGRPHVHRAVRLLQSHPIRPIANAAPAAPAHP